MLRKSHIDDFAVPPFQTAALERFVQHQFVARPGARQRHLETFEVLEVLELAAVDQRFANEQRGVAASRRMVRLVGDNLEVDSARHGIVQCDGNCAAAGIEFAGSQSWHHLCGSRKIQKVDVQSFLGEISFGIGHEERRIRR